MDNHHSFLSHNHKDSAAVTYIAVKLYARGIKCWLSSWNLVPGERWMEKASKALDSSDTCAVFIGSSGLGPWQEREIQIALEREVQTRGAFRIIPVFLPGGKQYKQQAKSLLLDFLTPVTWVEFDNNLDEEEPFRRLNAGISGVEPGPAPSVRPELSAHADDECPYRGLEPFEVDNARFYFGREDLLAELLGRVRQLCEFDSQRFLTVIGPSGSGKSSLVQAGLMHKLLGGALDGSKDWPLVLFKPGSDPLRSLAIALETHTKKELVSEKIEELEAKLLNNSTTLDLYARTAWGAANPSRSAVLLVDQFEEIYSLCNDAEKRNAFVNNLLDATAPGRHKLVVVISLRADFFRNCFDNKELLKFVSERPVAVTPMSKEDLARVIEKPAELVNCRFQDGLIELILRDLEEASMELPILEHVLLKLWSRKQGDTLTRDAYKEIGGIVGALEQHADDVYLSFSDAEKDECKRIFLRLTQPVDGAEDTKRRAVLTEMVSAVSNRETAMKVLLGLASPRARLIMTSGSMIAEGSGYAEVTHEALIRHWPRLRGWVDEDREGLQILHRLTSAAEEWSANHHRSSFLYQGTRLSVTLDWARRNDEKLSDEEKLFLERSRRRRLFVRAGLVAGACAIVLTAAAVIFLAIRARNLNYEVRRKSDEQQLQRMLDKLPGVWLDEGKMRGWLQEAEEFSDPVDRHAGLNDVLDERLRLFRLGDAGEVAMTRKFVEKLRALDAKTLDEQKDNWNRVRDEVTAANSKYAGLHPKPIRGLIPLGQDPVTHLQEFAHYLSGEVPARDGDGRLVINDDSAMVFVLVPAGTFFMGDDNHETIERPVTRITLDAFLISKYEMTAGQWLRVTFVNPSKFKDDPAVPDKMKIPVDSVKWNDVDGVVRRLGLMMPTEAQWEYVARAGTTGDWFVDSAAEAAEAGCLSSGVPESPNEFRGHPCEVDYGKTNNFGLYGIIGNNWEWCLDPQCSYAVTPAKGTGERVCKRAVRLFRGGSYFSEPENARSSVRRSYPPSYGSGNIGVRPLMRLEGWSE